MMPVIVTPAPLDISAPIGYPSLPTRRAYSRVSYSPPQRSPALGRSIPPNDTPRLP